MVFKTFLNSFSGTTRDMFILKTILKVIKVIGSETAPASIAFALVLGMILGLNPLLSIQCFLILFVVLIFRVNIASTLFSMALFKLLSFPLGPHLHKTGVFLLEKESLNGVWTWMYNTAPFPLTRFYNSVFLGGLTASLVLTPVVFVAGIVIVMVYRHKLEPAIRNSKIAKVIAASKMYKLYVTLTSPIGGEK